MSWLFSQALVEEYLAANSLDGEQSAQLNGKPIQQAYCAPDKMTVFSRLSRFGMTFKPLTENPGEELSMSSVVAFHARTLVPQEKAQELTENDQGCGEKWRGSFTKYDQNTFSWKTHQCSLLGDLDEFLETWPQWGLMRDGECWEQRTLEQTIRATESGLSENKWATPTTMDKLPPKSEQALLREATVTRLGRSKPANLRDQVSNMHNWPTPTTRDYKGANGFETTKKKIAKGLRAHMGQLPNAVQHMEKKPIGGTLNPIFVEWLMGWPLGWTDLKPLETDKSHCAPQQHGEF